MFLIAINISEVVLIICDCVLFLNGSKVCYVTRQRKIKSLPLTK